VGRGPIAGPVAVSAFLCARQDLAEILKGIDLPIRDSKKLTKTTFFGVLITTLS